jgi:hypothetical protein
MWRSRYVDQIGFEDYLTGVRDWLKTTPASITTKVTGAVGLLLKELTRNRTMGGRGQGGR